MSPSSPRQFDALASGDRDGASGISASLAEPAFAAAVDPAVSVAVEEHRRADAAADDARRRAAIGAGILVGACGLLFWSAGTHRRRDLDRLMAEAHGRRFSALVESSRDVITVVNRDGGMSLMSPDAGVLQQLIRTKSPTHVRQLFADPGTQMRWLEADQRLTAGGDHEQLTFSLAAIDGRSVHLEAVGSRLEGSANEHVWVWRDVTERHELQLQLSRLAYSDPLTGLANRAQFVSRAERALERAVLRGRPTSVLYCDLDDFKQVNDVYGHATGDRLLITIAERLRTCTRQRDLVARLGGDEFAMLLEETDAEVARSSADRILKAVTEVVELGNGVVMPRVSIGIATAVAGSSVDELLGQSDMAMYSAKHSGKGRVGVFSGER